MGRAHMRILWAIEGQHRAKGLQAAVVLFTSFVELRTWDVVLGTKRIKAMVTDPF